MKTLLNFELEETKELLSKFDYGYFLKQHIEEESYEKIDIERIYITYSLTQKKIIELAKENKKQFNLYAESYIRKSFTGGHLPGWLGLDETRSITIMDFDAVGENWAYFDYWKRYQRHKMNEEKVWNIITKVGSVLGIILTLYTLIKLLF